MAYDDLVQALGATAYYKCNVTSGALVNAISKRVQANFDAANTAAGVVPNADSGQAFTLYAEAGSSGWRVLNNYIIDTSIANESFLLLDGGLSDGTWTATVAVLPTSGDGGLFVRASSGSGLNGILLNLEGTQYGIYQRVNGTYTNIGAVAKAPAVGDVMTITAIGPTITCQVGGVSTTVTNSTNVTGSYFGVRSSNANQAKTLAFDSFTAALPSTAPASGLTYRQPRVLPSKGDVDQSAVSMSAAGDIQLPRSGVGHFLGGFSIAGWVSFQAATAAGTGQVIFACADLTGSYNGFTVYSDNGMNNISFSFKTGTSLAYTAGVGGVFATDGSDKHLVVMTVSAVASGGIITGYVDTLSSSATLGQTIAMSTNPLHVGYIEDTFWQRLTGRVSNVALWNRVLTATEVGRLYRVGFREGVTY